MANVLKFFKRKRSASLAQSADSIPPPATNAPTGRKASQSISDSGAKQLRKAIISNDFAQMRKTLDAQPQLVNSVLNDSEQTALHLASELGSLEMMEYLLKLGADPNKLDESLQSPVHLSLNSMQAFLLLLRQKSVDLTVLNIRKESILHLLAKRFSQVDEEVWRILRKRSVDFNLLNASGDTPLHIACSNGYYKLAVALIEAGALVNHQNKRGETPVYIAAQQGNTKLIRALVRHGANPQVAAVDGSTALDVASSAEVQALLKPINLERRSSKSQVKSPLGSSTGSNSPRSQARRSLQVSFNEMNVEDGGSDTNGSGSSLDDPELAELQNGKRNKLPAELRRTNSQPMSKNTISNNTPHDMANLHHFPDSPSMQQQLGSSPGRARSRSFTSASNRLLLLDERASRGGDFSDSSAPGSNRGSSERFRPPVLLNAAEQMHMREKIEVELIGELQHILDGDFVVDVINRVLLESKSFEWSRDLDTNKIEVLKWMSEFVAVEQKQKFLEYLYNNYHDKIDIEVIQEPTSSAHSSSRKTYSSPKKVRRKSSGRDRERDRESNHRFTIRAKKLHKYDWEIDYCDIQFVSEIGHGSFGTVYRGYWMGLEVAIKKHHAHMDETEIPAFLKEIAILSQLQHPNIVRFLGASIEADLCLVTEYCELGDLRSFLAKNAPVDPLIKLKFALDIAQGLQYLHSQNPPIVHRDLKCANILLSGYKEIKVSDFGLSNTANARSTNRLGTLNWLAPEVLRGTEKYSMGADIYSIGMCIYEIARDGKSPYDDMMPLQIVRAIDEGEKPEIPANCNPVFASIMQRCWVDEPAERPSLKVIIQELQAEYSRLKESQAPSISPRRPRSPREQITLSPRRTHTSASSSPRTVALNPDFVLSTSAPSPRTSKSASSNK